MDYDTSSASEGETNENSSNKKYFTICYHYVNELNKHGYVNRSEVINKQKLNYQKWVFLS